MSETQDETAEAADVDAGWDDDDTVAEPAPSGSPPSLSSEPEPSAEEVDDGWGDVPDDDTSGAGPGPTADGATRRRPHRKRRPKSSALPMSANPVLLPRPAEPTKKQNREHARQQRAHEAQAKQQRKAQRKAERAEDAKRAAAERSRRAEAEEQARKARQEARERAQSDRPAPKPRPTANKPARAKQRPAELKRSEPDSTRSTRNTRQMPAKAKPRYGVFITLLVLAVLGALLLLRK